jgi:hypothetical protein
MPDVTEEVVIEQNPQTSGEVTLFPISPEEPFKVVIEKSLVTELTAIRRPEELPVYGLLLGEKIRAEGGGFHIIQIHEHGPDAGAGMSVFKKEQVLALRRAAMAADPDLEILGWCAIHDLGSSPSAREEDTHRLFFAEPWNLFIVTDNSREKTALFRFEDGALRETLLTIESSHRPIPRTREHKTLLAEIERLKSEKDALEKALDKKTGESGKIVVAVRPAGSKIIDRPLCTRGDRERQMRNLERSMSGKQGRPSPPAGGKVLQFPTAPEQKFSPAEMSAFGKRMLFLAGATLVLLIIVAVVSILAEQSGDSQTLFAPGTDENDMLPLDEPAFKPAPPAARAPAKPSERAEPRTKRPPASPSLVKQQPAPQKESAPPVEYVVQQGDNAWKIAEKTLGNGTLGKKVLAFNGLDEKSKLKIGQKLNIPPK